MPLQLRRVAGGEPIWLSSVVLEELYAGASVKNRHIVERFERDFARAGRVLVPNLKDWVQAGKVLALVVAEYDFEQIGRGRLANDALIAMSAARTGVTVITANARDFEKWRNFADSPGTLGI
jgi:predicted nucleic acid-binding protein